MSYESKYLKYKKKYIELREMIGGKPASETPKFKIFTYLDKLFDVGSRTSFDFIEVIPESELEMIFGPTKKEELLEFFNTNIRESLLGPIHGNSAFDTTRDTNPKSKEIFNKSDLSRKDLIELFYNLSPNSLRNNNYNEKSVKLLDETILNEKLEGLISLYSNINDVSKFYSNGVSYPTSKIEGLPISSDVYYIQKIKIPNTGKIHYIGDIHGSLMSLVKLIVKDLKEIFNDDLTLKTNDYLIFTGDIVDYSQLGLECLYLVSMLKLKNPEKVFICDGNHEDYNQYSIYQETRLSAEILKEITNLDIRKNVHKVLKLFPTVIIVDYNDSLFQFNHGSHPLIPQANSFKLKEYLASDKDFLLLSYGIINSTSLGYSYKWGDFTQVKVRRDERNVDRPVRSLEETKAYLEEFGISCILSGHQDIVPLSVIGNRVINGTDEIFKDKKHNYKLSVGYYHSLTFPGIKELGDTNIYREKFIDRTKLIPLNADGTPTTERLEFPDKQKYKYVFNPSNLSKANTELDLPARILAMTQSTAGISFGKYINYTIYSTLTKN